MTVARKTPPVGRNLESIQTVESRYQPSWVENKERRWVGGMQGERERERGEDKLIKEAREVGIAKCSQH